MKMMHAEREYSVSILEDELLALGLKYRFQHLPEALPPEPCSQFVHCEAPCLDFIVPSERLDFVTALLFSNRKRKCTWECPVKTVNCSLSNVSSMTLPVFIVEQKVSCPISLSVIIKWKGLGKDFVPMLGAVKALLAWAGFSKDPTLTRSHLASVPLFSSA